MEPKKVFNEFEIQQIKERVEKLASSLPKRISNHIFHAFKRRKILRRNDSIGNIAKRESCFKESQLRKELAKEAKRRHEQTFHRQHIHITVNNSIHTSIVPTLKEYLEPKRLIQTNRFCEYIEANKLPASLIYNAIDFQQATGDKYLHLKPHELLLHIGSRYKSKITASFEGTSTEVGKTLYDTKPVPFRPLYFDMVKIVVMLLPGHKMGLFKEHLIHLYNKELKDFTYSLLHCHGEQELDNIIDRLHNQFNYSLWIPEQIKYKDKQMELYFKNKDFLKPELLRVLAHNYLKLKSEHGTNEELIKNLTPSDIILGIKEGLENTLKLSKIRARNGWTIFESAPQKDSYLYNELVKVLHKLGGKVATVSNRRTKISSYSRPIMNYMKKYKMVQRTEILYKEATS